MLVGAGITAANLFFHHQGVIQNFVHHDTVDETGCRIPFDSGERRAFVDAHVCQLLAAIAIDLVGFENQPLSVAIVVEFYEHHEITDNTSDLCGPSLPGSSLLLLLLLLPLLLLLAKDRPLRCW